MAAPTTKRVTARGLEVRTSGDSCTVEGYASTTEQAYDMGWYEETVKRGAFKKTLAEDPDVRFLVNHDGLPLARTRSGTLELSEDNTGLWTRATLDPADPDVAQIVPKLQRGDIDQMSFAFRVVRQEWNEDYTERFLTELSLANGDVSVVTYPANPNTSVSLRARTVLDADPEELRAAYRAIHEERAGKTISAATRKQLESVLESLTSIGDANETAVETIADLIGTAGEAKSAPTRTGTHPSVVRERLRAAGLTL
jgi:HK97 family phage prohead protease